MSVYTKPSQDEINTFLDSYDLGEVISLKGITQGITNTNYFLTTSTGSYVLTIFESLKKHELPFFLELKRHLSNLQISCPTPISRKDGQLASTLSNKPACIVSKLKGRDISHPNNTQCFNTGKMLATVHLAGQSFPMQMKNTRYTEWWKNSTKKLLPVLGQDDANLLQSEITYLDKHLNKNLPKGIIHADLFKDNVLLEGDNVTGFIDFYYACNGDFIYDLAIAINDWARTASNSIDPNLANAFLRGYTSIRPINTEEQSQLHIAQRAGCIRFWVSRLLDFHFPQEGDLTFIKNPNSFKNLLLSLQKQPIF